MKGGRSATAYFLDLSFVLDMHDFHSSQGRISMSYEKRIALDADGPSLSRLVLGAWRLLNDPESQHRPGCGVSLRCAWFDNLTMREGANFSRKSPASALLAP